jgi:hypothetical protein
MAVRYAIYTIGGTRGKRIGRLGGDHDGIETPHTHVDKTFRGSGGVSIDLVEE